MSMGEIGGVIGPCEECRHTHGTSSCATCGGGIGYVGPPTLVPCRACLDGIAAAPAIAAGGDDADLILVDDEAPTEVLDRAEVESAAICAAAAEAIRQYEAGETLEWPDEPDANKMQAAVDDIDAGRVRPMADVVAALAEPSWRLALTDCVSLLKSIADKDPPAAAGYAMRFRELLTKAEQYGS